MRSSNVGRGVFALKHFKAKKRIGKIKGTVYKEVDHYSDYCMDYGDGMVMDADPPFRFLNHSCDPNCELIIWEGDSVDDKKLCLHSIKSIKPGDELTIDYAWPSSDAIPCLCRTNKCRGWIVSEAERPMIQL